MKKFRFSLKSVQTVRSIRELRAREVFSSAVLALSAAETELGAARQRLGAFERVLLQERGALFRAAEQGSFLQEYALVRAAEASAAQQVAKATAHMQKCREQWIATRRDVRVIEKLEGRALEQYRRECEHEEQAAADDRSNAVIGRALLITS